MKKTFGLAAAALLTFSLTACGGGSDDSASSDETTATQSSPTQSQESSPTPSEDSGDEAAAYCNLLEDTKAQFQNLSEGDLTQQVFEDLNTKIGELEDSAPTEVKDDWGTLGDGIGGLLDLLDQAGLTFDDLTAIQQGDIPKDLDPAKLQKLGQEVQKLDLGGDQFQQATQAIQQHAKAECGLDLNSGS